MMVTSKTICQKGKIWQLLGHSVNLMVTLEETLGLSGIPPLGTVNICTAFHRNQWNAPDVSVTSVSVTDHSSDLIFFIVPKWFCLFCSSPSFSLSTRHSWGNQWCNPPCISYQPPSLSLQLLPMHNYIQHKCMKTLPATEKPIFNFYLKKV